jgi:hypothetical protein
MREDERERTCDALRYDQPWIADGHDTRMNITQVVARGRAHLMMKRGAAMMGLGRRARAPAHQRSRQPAGSSGGGHKPGIRFMTG